MELKTALGLVFYALSVFGLGIQLYLQYSDSKSIERECKLPRMALNDSEREHLYNSLGNKD